MSHTWEVEPILSTSNIGRCFSPSNIALAKYWGKRDVSLNLPTNGSISCTLSKIGTNTTVEFDASFKVDRLILGQTEQSGVKLEKVIKNLDLLRNLSGVNFRARVQSENNFPTGAGLASSASGMSALIFAAARALELGLSNSKLSELARRASGSACRSLFGGFVEWRRGAREDGSDSTAYSIADSSYWPLRALVCITNENEKSFTSTSGMEETRNTSPYFNAWTSYAENILPEFKESIEKRNFQRLAELSEDNCLRMHASAIGASPGILYWSGMTVEIIHLVRRMRAQGESVFFTIDAGPNVVVFAEECSLASAKKQLLKLDLRNIIDVGVGEGTYAI